MEIGDVFTASVTPDRYTPHRYAGAAEDFNPIHVDPEFARAVGLPRNILHGLYTMGLAARATLEAMGGDPRALRRIDVQFRGMGFPEEEIVVRGSVVHKVSAGLQLEISAEQDDRSLIRNGEVVVVI